MSTTQLANKKILLVEDNKTNQMVAQIMLKKIGYQTELAENGQEAIDKTAQTDYDVIFMDVNMPVVDGYEATKTIRQREQSQGKVATPIIAMTAGDDEDIIQCIAVGMHDHLKKPFKKEELEQILLKWCRT